MLPLLLAAGLAAAADSEQSLINRPDAPIEARLHAEVGFLAPVSHTIQFGQDGTELDYVKDGGQDNLFPFLRFSGDLYIGKKGRNIVTLLYQPLDLRTEVVLNEELRVDDEVFAAGTPMDLRYGFSFWRGSWMYDVLPAEQDELGIGLSLQIRNATINFASANGDQRQAYRNIGPVPIIKLRYRHDFEKHWFVGTEIDGFWAPIRLLNGSDSDVEGAIVDWSARAGYRLLRGTETALTLRYIGGGAVGTSNRPTTGDGYNRNWLHFLTLSLAVTLR